MRRLERRLETVLSSPGGGVPTIHFRDIKNNAGNIPAAALDKVLKALVITSFISLYQLRRSGVIVIKKVFDTQTVSQMESSLQSFVLDRSSKEEGPEMDVFW